jgi:hypothetical protein
MKLIHLVGIALIAAGAAGLAFGEFSYTKEEHRAELGPIEFRVEERETVNIPRWAGIGGIAAGAIFLVAASIKRI